MTLLQVKVVCTALIQWALMRERPTELEDQQPQCYSLCWTTRYSVYKSNKINIDLVALGSDMSKRMKLPCMLYC